MTREIDRRSGKPVYRQVADDLRARIKGEMRAGQLMPAEPALMEEYDVSRATLRQAIALLRSEGLVVTEHGRGTFVRSAQPARRVGSDRYRAEIQMLRSNQEHPLETAFTRELDIAWEDFRLDTEYTETDPPPRIAAALRLNQDDRVLRRFTVMYASDLAEQIRYSFYPLDLVAGTPVADPANQPWPGGTLAELASLGVAPTSVVEGITGRMPTPDEEYMLEIATGVPVFVINRVFLTNTHPVEATHIVIPCDRVELEYKIDL